MRAFSRCSLIYSILDEGTSAPSASVDATPLNWRVLAIIILYLGYHSYFDSIANKGWRVECEQSSKDCTNSNTTYNSVACEKAAVIIISLLVFLTVLFLVLPSLAEGDIANKADLVYQILAGILFIISGILFIYSVITISKTVENSGRGPFGGGSVIDKKAFQLYDEKVAAGALCIINGVLHLVAAFFVFKG